jgi:hypothetical protein
VSDSFNRLLKTWARQPAASSGVCPDAEVLAAFVDHSLPERAHEAVVTHLADCGRCIEHVAVLSRCDDALPGSRPVSPWSLFGWVRRPWLVPAMAAAIVAVIWTALPSDNQRTGTEERTMKEEVSAGRKQLGGRAVQAPAATPPPAASGLARPVASQEPTTVDRLDDKGAAVGSARAATDNEREDLPAARDKSNVQASAPQRRLSAAASKGQLAPAGPPPVAAPAETDRSRIAESVAIGEARQKSADAVAPNDDERARSKVLSETKAAESYRREAFADAASVEQQNASPPVAPGAAGGPLNQQAQTASPAAPLSMAKADVPLVYPSPDPTVKWRVAGTRVERTIDGGNTWITDRAPSVTGVRNGASPSRDVCWLVGDAGLVVRREASGSWTVVTPPVAATLIAIAAPSASDALVTAADGRRFGTIDGGHTWALVNP